MTGNDFLKLTRKLVFAMLPTSGTRTRWIYKHKNLFKHIGENLFFQPRNFPDQPELISIGNNVKIASGVVFVNHDIIHTMLNDKFKENKFKPFVAPIKIDDNVMIGANTMIMPNVHICSDVIIAAGSIISKNIDLPGVWGGIPAKHIKSIEEFIAKRLKEQ